MSSQGHRAAGECQNQSSPSRGEDEDVCAVWCCVQGLLWEIAITNGIISYNLKKFHKERVSGGGPVHPMLTCAGLGPSGHVWAEGHLLLALTRMTFMCNFFSKQQKKFFYRNIPICYLSGSLLKRLSKTLGKSHAMWLCAIVCFFPSINS